MRQNLGLFIILLFTCAVVCANESFVNQLETLIEKDDSFSLQVIDGLLQLEERHPDQSGRIQLELSRIYLRVKDWPAAKAALNKVKSRPNLPAAVAARISLLQESIEHWENEPVWDHRVLVSTRFGRDYRIDDYWHSEGAALRTMYQDQYVPLLNRTIRVAPMINIKGIQQGYETYGDYQYIEANVGAKFYFGRWRWTQELGVAQRYEQMGAVSDTHIKYRINRGLSSYIFASMFRSSGHISRESGVGVQWRLAPKWLLTADLGQEDRLVDINRYSRERLETQIYWRSNMTLSARYRHALSNEGYNEIYQRLTWPLADAWSLTQSISWHKDSGWRLANAFVGIEWRY